MKRILFYRLLLALVLGFMFGMFVFAAAPGDVQLQPLIDFEPLFEELREWFTDILKEHYVLILSFFAVWFIFGCVMSFLQNKVERWKAEKRIKHSIVFRENLRKEQEDIRREEAKAKARMKAFEEKEREMDRITAMYNVGAFAAMVRNLKGNEQIVHDMSGKYYIETTSQLDEGSSSVVMGRKTPEEWQAERDAENTFDSNENSDAWKKYREWQFNLLSDEEKSEDGWTRIGGGWYRTGDDYSERYDAVQDSDVKPGESFAFGQIRGNGNYDEYQESSDDVSSYESPSEDDYIILDYDDASFSNFDRDVDDWVKQQSQKFGIETRESFGGYDEIDREYERNYGSGNGAFRGGY